MAPRRIAIVGSGISGLLAGHALRQAGHEVTLYSERSASYWLHTAPPTRGAHLTIGPSIGNRLLTSTGRLAGSGVQAVDVRLQSHRWMTDLAGAGGRIVIEKLDLDT